jgi:hypothetical protein
MRVKQISLMEYMLIVGCFAPAVVIVRTILLYYGVMK